MPVPFLVTTSSHYERLARVLLKRYPKFGAAQQRAVEILEQDSTNRSGSEISLGYSAGGVRDARSTRSYCVHAHVNVIA